MKNKILSLLGLLMAGTVAVAQTAPSNVPNNYFSVGKTGAANKTFEFNLTAPGASTNPKFRWNNSTTKLQFSNDGTTFTDVGAGSFVNPMTTLGDIIYGGASGTPTRLGATSDGQVLTLSSGIPSWAPPGSAGVTSVGLALPSIFTVSGSPVTTTGTLTGALNAQSANTVFAGGASASATPTFRALVGADLPNPSASTLGGVESKAATTSNWINSISTSGVPSLSQPAFTDISGNLAVTQLNSGTGASSSTFWRGDGTWAAPAGSGTVTSVAMTVPTFLSVSGSPITSSGTLAVSLSGTALPLANGGTGQITKAAAFAALAPYAALGDLVYGGTGGAGAPTVLSGNTTATTKVLTQTGTGSVSAAPIWTDPATLPIGLLTPNIQSFTSGTGTYGLSYWFIVTSANATVGATYTNNSNTFTVARTISGATTLLCTSNGAPAASGTLTKASGTGDSTITFSAVRAPLYLEVELVAGGGGGGGSGATSGNGQSGGTTSFGSSLLTATGGGGGGGGSGAGGTGGGVTVNSPAIIVNAVPGATGSTFTGNIAATSGGFGASSPLSGGGPGGAGAATATVGVAATSNTGSGGGGASGNVSFGGSAGGGAGGFIEAIVYSPSATYAWQIGVAGSSGNPGTSGAAGGLGGSGIIIVKEYFQ